MEPNHIGRLQSFNEKSFKASLSACHRVESAIEELKEIYEGLDIGQFDQNSWEEFINNGTKHAEEVYTEAVKADVARAKYKTRSAKAGIMNEIPKDLAPLKESWEQLKSIFNREQRGDGYNTIYLELNYFNIVEGLPQLNQDLIKNACSILIQTETQSRLYQMLIDIKSKYDEMLKLFEEHGVEIPPLFSDNSSLFSRQEKRQITITDQAPFLIDQLLKMKAYQEAVAKRQEEEGRKQREAREKQWASITHDPQGRPYAVTD